MTLRPVCVFPLLLLTACTAIDTGGDEGVSSEPGGKADDPAGGASGVMTEPFVTAGPWQWLNPIPYDGELRAVAALADGSVWIGGEAGVVIRWTGSEWQHIPTGTDEAIAAAWAIDADDVWLTADRGLLLHWTGDAVSLIDTPATGAIRGVWGRASDDVWFTSDDGYILHWDGAEVTMAYWVNYFLRGVTGLPGGDGILAVGGGSGTGRVVEFDGTTWSQAEISDDILIGVGATPSGDIYAVDDTGINLRTGGVWYQLAMPAGIFGIEAQWVSPSGTLYLTDYQGHVARIEGESTASVTYAGYMGSLGLHGRSDDDVWVVGDHGQIVRVVDGEDETISLDMKEPLAAMSLVHRDVVVLDSGTALIGTMVSHPGGGHHHELIRWEGDSWTASEGPDDGLMEMWAADEDDVRVTSTYDVARRKAGSWFGVACDGEQFGAIDGASAGNVWIATDGGKLCRHDGVTTKMVSTPTSSRISDIWMVSDSLGFATAGNHVLRLLNGQWVKLPDPPGDDVSSVWASSANDVWVSGFVDGPRHWNGMTWTEVPLPEGTLGVTDIWGSGEGEVWFTTWDRLIRRSGGEWQVFAAPGKFSLHGRADTAFAVDLGGGVLRLAP